MGAVKACEATRQGLALIAQDHEDATLSIIAWPEFSFLSLATGASRLPSIAPQGAMGEGKAQRPFECFVKPMGG